MRLALILGWIGVLVAVAWPLLRRARAPRPVPAMPAADGELVKDPVCQTYVVRARAVRDEAGGGPRYFCSAECARRFARR